LIRNAAAWDGDSVVHIVSFASQAIRPHERGTDTWCQEPWPDV
jgi:hypothetical protein